jgi:KaiC/GvpD/RAD55 family RecA-like ATPase
MTNLHIEEQWMQRLIPQGLPVETSTLITGPGGSGKPLIGNVIAGNWLRQNGSVVFMSLQYPDRGFIYEGMRRVAGVELGKYEGRVVFIELDAELDGMEAPIGNHIRANLVKPSIWDAAIEQACTAVPNEGPGVLVFGSALNLLLFSPTYGEELLDYMKTTLGAARQHTSLFSVSSSAKQEMIHQLEVGADNLLVSRSSKEPFRLFLRVERMKGVVFSPEEIEVPITAETLEDVKLVADHSRKRVIPLISKI